MVVYPLSKYYHSAVLFMCVTLMFPKRSAFFIFSTLTINRLIKREVVNKNINSVSAGVVAFSVKQADQSLSEKGSLICIAMKVLSAQSGCGGLKMIICTSIINECRGRRLFLKKGTFLNMWKWGLISNLWSSRGMFQLLWSVPIVTDHLCTRGQGATDTSPCHILIGYFCFVWNFVKLLFSPSSFFPAALPLGFLHLLRKLFLTQ